MPKDQIDNVVKDWNDARPELSTEALGLVLRIQALAKAHTAQLTETLNSLSLEWWEYDVLSALRRQGPPYQLSASEITKCSRISPGAVTNRIDRLLDRKLVKRIEDPDDRRRVLVALSSDGVALVNRASEARFACADQAISRLSMEQRQELNHLLRTLLGSEY
jgi:DNA-binding MarR family transcriptional regulator